MKTKLFLVALFGLFMLAGCDDDGDNGKVEPEDTSIYYVKKKEKITKELKNVPAYVLKYEETDRDIIFICYSEYADEYFDALYGNSTVIPNGKYVSDISLHKIGVNKTDFERYNIAYPNKIYVSASVTDNNKMNLTAGIDPGWGNWISPGYKAYLHDVKPRN